MASTVINNRSLKILKGIFRVLNERAVAVQSMWAVTRRAGYRPDTDCVRPNRNLSKQLNSLYHPTLA